MMAWWRELRRQWKKWNRENRHEQRRSELRTGRFMILGLESALNARGDFLERPGRWRLRGEFLRFTLNARKVSRVAHAALEEMKK